MYRFFIVFSCLLVAWGGTSATVHAVEVPTAGNVLSVSLSPDTPQPYGTVTIRPESTLIDLSAQTIQIFVNGTEIQKGTGAISATTTVGGAGETTTIKVVATSPSGVVSTAQTVLRPADVALIVEPGTSVHPFYEGASLIAPETPIRIVAVTNFKKTDGTLIPSSSLVYTWKFGDRVLQSDSGIGKSVLSVISPVKYRDANVSVTVSTGDSSLVAKSSVLVSPTDPFVLLYQHDPLLGVLFSSALTSSYAMNTAEATFRAVGFYFKTAPTFSWLVNSAASGTGKDLTVRSNGQGQGTALLGVTAKDSSEASANALLSVLFGNKASSGIFGL